MLHLLRRLWSRHCVAPEPDHLHARFDAMVAWRRRVGYRIWCLYLRGVVVRMEE
jgi:hypothetical protein